MNSFKKGTKVIVDLVVIDQQTPLDERAFLTSLIGQTGIICEVLDAIFPYYVEFENGFIKCFRECELSAITREG